MKGRSWSWVPTASPMEGAGVCWQYSPQRVILRWRLPRAPSVQADEYEIPFSEQAGRASYNDTDSFTLGASFALRARLVSARGSLRTEHPNNRLRAAGRRACDSHEPMMKNNGAVPLYRYAAGNSAWGTFPV